MILYIVLVSAAIFGIYWTIKIKKIFPAIITGGMILGIILTMILSKSSQLFGIYIYMGFVTLSFIYCLVAKELSTKSRIIIAFMSAAIFFYWLWVLNHWHGNTLLLPIFTILIGLAGIFSKEKLKNELGFLSILFADAIAILIESWMKMN